MPSVLQHIINDWIYYLVRVGVNSVNGKLSWTVCSLGFLKRKQKYPKKFNVNVINCHIKEWFKCWFKLNNRVQIRIIFQYSLSLPNRFIMIAVNWVNYIYSDFVYPLNFMIVVVMNEHVYFVIMALVWNMARM